MLLVAKNSGSVKEMKGEASSPQSALPPTGLTSLNALSIGGMTHRITKPVVFAPMKTRGSHLGHQWKSSLPGTWASDLLAAQTGGSESVRRRREVIHNEENIYELD